MDKLNNFIRRCDQMMVGCFFALIYFLPISIALTEACSGLAIGCYIFKRLAMFIVSGEGKKAQKVPLPVAGRVGGFFLAFKPKSNYLNAPLALFMSINFITVFLSHYPHVSFIGFLGKILQSVFIFFTFIECMTSLKRLKPFLILFSVSVFLVCVNGFYQGITGAGFIHGNVFAGRLFSSMRAANDYAAYLVVVTLFLFYVFVLVSSSGEKGKSKECGALSFLYSRWARLAMFILLLMAIISLGLTYSRGAWLAFLLCLFLPGFENKKLLLVSALLAIIFSAVFFPRFDAVRFSVQEPSMEESWLTPKSYPGSTSEQVSPEGRQGPGLLGLGSWTSFRMYNNRLGYWSRSLKIIRDYPLLGSGINTYSIVQWHYKVGWGGYPHNSYLQMTAETGIIGLLSFLWILWVLYRNSFRNLKNMRVPVLRILLMSFLAGLMGFLMHSFVDTDFYGVQLSSLMWLLMGIVVALQRIDKENRPISS